MGQITEYVAYVFSVVFVISMGWFIGLIIHSGVKASNGEKKKIKKTIAMKKILVVSLLAAMCLSVGGCGSTWCKCFGCGPGYEDPYQMQVADPCWPCWEARAKDAEEKIIKEVYMTEEEMEEQNEH